MYPASAAKLLHHCIGASSIEQQRVHFGRDGGGFGSIIGRNTFQRPRDEALAMLDTIIKIYQNKA